MAECTCVSLLNGHMPDCPYIKPVKKPILTLDSISEYSAIFRASPGTNTGREHFVTRPKFVADQKVVISSTVELPTRHNGSVGYIMSQSKSHPEFWRLITFSGDDSIFHESQLRAWSSEDDKGR